jgi:hypothetical protein
MVGEETRTKDIVGDRMQAHHTNNLHIRIKFEYILDKFRQASMTNQKNTEASIRNLETQVRQLEK